MSEYQKFSKVQKIAAFLITMGPEAAAEVMKSFDNVQLELICREITALPLLDPLIQKEVLQEFTSVVTVGVSAAAGGVGFAQRALERAKGDFAASSILNRCAPTALADEGEEIRTMEGQQLLNLLKSEQPQTIAFIISCMETPKAAELITLLPEAVREEVVERLGNMEPTSRDSIRRVTKNLTRHFDRRASQQGLHRAGGVNTCADLLNAMDKDIRKTLLNRIEERNAALGAAIRKKTFSFEEIARLSPGDMARVLRDVDSADLPLALKTAKPALVTTVLSTMSKRAAEAFKEELEMLANPRPKEVEAAQDRIIQIVRKLEEAEEITLDDAAPAGGGFN